nr:MAG TPA: hypothetical protein [Caudoviricetes sp.]
MSPPIPQNKSTAVILILLFPPFIVLIKPWYYRTGWLF